MSSIFRIFPTAFTLDLSSAYTSTLKTEAITSRKVAGARSDEVFEFFSIYSILPAAL
jgi:hypothetical protein